MDKIENLKKMKKDWKEYLKSDTLEKKLEHLDRIKKIIMENGKK